MKAKIFTNVVFISLILFSFANGATYQRSDGQNGAFSLINRSDAKFISLKNFCETLKCKVTYQWSQIRAVIHVPNSKSSALITPLASVVLVDGNLIEFEGDVISDPAFGYLLPPNLAKKMAAVLGLGVITINDLVVEKKPEKTSGKVQEKISVKKDVMSGKLAPGTGGSQPLRDFKLLVLDPGHGGNDFGTKSSSLYEKDIALIYAKKLKEHLNKEIPDLTVILTREMDEYVSLPDRAKLANEKEAGLFISLHINHADNKSIQGTETYILNPNATDDDAKRTAMLENDLFLRSIKTQDQDSNVLKILADMEQTKYIQSSALIAAYIQQELSSLDASIGVKNRGVKQAMFYVLSQAAMPSVLVEMGFLSNFNDRKRLMDLKFQESFVAKVTAAIKRYRRK